MSAAEPTTDPAVVSERLKAEANACGEDCPGCRKLRESASTIDTLLARVAEAERPTPEQTRKAAVMLRELVAERFGKRVFWSTAYDWAGHVLAAAFAATASGGEG